MDDSCVVWCDFGGVLTEPIPEVLGRFCHVAGVPAGPLLAAFEKVAAQHGMKALEPLERGVLSEAEWGGRVAGALAPDWRPRVDLARFGEIWYADREFNTALFQRLAATPVRLGLLTNSVREWEPHRERITPRWDAFTAMIKSHEVGVCKPDPGIFLLAEETIAAGHHVLIDDSVTNCAAARAHGWSAITHTSNERTTAELTRVLGSTF